MLTQRKEIQETGKVIHLPMVIPDPKPELEQDEARQGVTGHNVRYVLAISLGAVVIAMVLVGVFALRY